MWEFLKELVNPESIIAYGGVALLFFVVFAETGLLIGFFLPGDSLIFISGLFCKTRPDLVNVSLFTLIAGLVAAAVIGNITGYWFGRRVGPALFRREDSLIFKKRYLERTKEFYDKHGKKTLILGRFLPYVRTFAPILAGVIRVDFRKFMVYNITGALAWICSLATAGYVLGEVEWVRNNVGWIVIGLIIITLIPVIPFFRRKKTP